MTKPSWFNNLNIYKLILLLVVILIITRIVAPETAQWIMSPILELARSAIDAFQGIGGTQ